MSERGSNRSRSHVFPIFDILSRSGDIRDQSRKLCKIGANFHVFGPKFFRGGPPKFLDQDYLIGVDGDHVIKFCGDGPRELGDPIQSNMSVRCNECVALCFVNILQRARS